MRSVAIDVSRSVICVCLLGTPVSSEKTVEPIEMPFGSRLVWANKEPYIRWGIIGATWLIRWIGLCGGGDAACR